MEDRISGGNSRPLQKARVRKDGWTKMRRKRFLDSLASTCNVRIAIEAAGLAPSSAYALRRRDPAFAALWKEALTIGYERLEETLLQCALEGVNAIEIDVEGAVLLPEPGPGAGEHTYQPGSGGSAKISSDAVQLAMLVLNRHRATVEGKGSPGGSRRRASSEETDAALRKKLDALARTLRANE